VLLIAFGSVLAMGLPVVTALLGLGTAFGAIALASQVIDMPDFAGELAAMIGLGVGIDYALFIVTRFRENRRGGDGVPAATVLAMDTAGRAVLFAGCTVMLSLLGMVVLGLSFLDGLAVSSAIAVLLACLILLAGVVVGLFTEAGSGISHHPYTKPDLGGELAADLPPESIGRAELESWLRRRATCD
jgi:putative drug exporter of the RND superfamily